MSPHAPQRRILLTLLALLLAVSLPRAGNAQVSTFATGLDAARSCLFDAAGNLYVIQRSPASQIVRCTPPSNAMTTWASGFNDPVEMVFDDAGNAFVADYGTGRIVKVSPDGATKTNFATIAAPSSITRDAAGNLYVCEYTNQQIDKITPAGVVSTYVPPFGIASGKMSMVTMDSDGTLYAGQVNPGIIYKIAPGGGSPVAYKNGMPSCVGLEKDDYGYWYSSSYDGEQIFRMPVGTGPAVAVAGFNGVAGHVDGTLAASRFNWPGRPALRDNLLYIPEYNGDDVRILNLFLASPVSTTSWGAIQALYR